MSTPKNKIGVVCLSLERYFDTRERKIKVKSRPVVIIGCEHDDAARVLDVDYELLPISNIKNATPDQDYDYPISIELKEKLGITGSGGYIRTHKTSWNHVKHMKFDPTLNNMKMVEPEIFNKILSLNEKWVTTRNAGSMA